MIGMVLAGTVGKDHVLIRRLRTLTFGLLTPFYLLIRFGTGVACGSGDLCRSVLRQDVVQGDWPSADRESVQVSARRRTVLHANDVHGADVRHNLCLVWAEP